LRCAYARAACACNQKWVRGRGATGVTMEVEEKEEEEKVVVVVVVVVTTTLMTRGE
jgi:hypothetical protein